MMDDDQPETAADQAAAWHARLNTRMVDAKDLQAFFSWRSQPGNAEAYAKVEAAWEGAGQLDNDPELRAALAEVATRRPRHHAAVAAFGMLLLVLTAGLFWYWLTPARYETRVGEQRLVRLEDGTRIRLDTATRIAVRLGSGERRVILESGQAFFAVAHDPRPFHVETGATRIRDIGTAFNVRRDGERASVALVKGAVAVSAGASPAEIQLAPGEQISAGSEGLGRRTRADMAALTAWTQGRIQFTGTPLGAAIAEVNRYNDKPVRLATPRLARETVNGGFETGDTEAFIAAVTALYPLKARHENDGSITLTD